MPPLTPKKPVGIVGYGAYVPRYRLPATEISRVWTDGYSGVPIKEKAVPGPDEDVITMSIEAARNALARTAGVEPDQLGAVWIGSESHPYAVKPSSTVVAEAIGAVPHVRAGDWEFACKAGTEALHAAIGLVGSEMADFALAVGMDTAQGRPADALEYTAGAGGAAYIVGPAEQALAVFEGSLSFVTDTPDFWRRAYQHYPSHGARFTGQPAYFKHILAATQELLTGLDKGPADYRYVVFHQPNAKFPQKVARQLGFKPEQVQTGLLVNEIGNTYAGSSLIGLAAVLDVAQPGDRILLVSFGSGAGSDAFSLRATSQIAARQRLAPLTQAYIDRRVEIDYGIYARFRKKLVTK